MLRRRVLATILTVQNNKPLSDSERGFLLSPGYFAERRTLSGINL